MTRTAKLSPMMRDLLHRIAEAEPPGYRSWRGRTIDALQARGVVECHDDPNDKLSRRYFWTITDAGRAALA